jgi:hypothetical protein
MFTNRHEAYQPGEIQPDAHILRVDVRSLWEGSGLRVTSELTVRVAGQTYPPLPWHSLIIPSSQEGLLYRTYVDLLAGASDLF